MTSVEIIRECKKVNCLHSCKDTANYYLQVVSPDICVLSEYSGSYYKHPLRKRGWHTDKLLKHLKEAREATPRMWATNTFMGDMDCLIGFLEAVILNNLSMGIIPKGK